MGFNIAVIPGDDVEQLSKFDAIYLSAATYPTVPDHIFLWCLLMPTGKGIANPIEKSKFEWLTEKPGLYRGAQVEACDNST